MQIRPMQGTFDTTGWFYLMRGSLERKCETIRIRVDYKKEFDWEVNPDECMLFLFIDERKPLLIMERPKLTRGNDDCWYFDAVKWLAEKRIGYEYNMPWKRAYRKSCSCTGPFWAGTLGIAHYRGWVRERFMSLSAKADAHIPGGSLTIFGRPACKVEVSGFGDFDPKKDAEQNNIAWKLSEAVNGPQNISEDEVVQFMQRRDLAVSDICFTSPEGKYISLASKGIYIRWEGLVWRLELAEYTELPETVQLMAALWHGDSIEEICRVLCEAADRQLGTIKPGPVIPKVPNEEKDCSSDLDQYDRFHLNHVLQMEGHLYLLAHSHDPLAVGTRIVFREGKKEKVMQLLINPKDCKWYYRCADSDVTICVPLEPAWLDDGNLLIEPGAWLDTHGIQWKLKPHRDCAAYWNHPARCWTWYKYW